MPKSRRLSFYCQAAMAALLLCCTGSSSAKEGRSIDFVRDIQPILAENCFACHGPDEKARKAKLRLDQRDAALSIREGGAAIVPGDSRRSTLYQRITTSDEDD